MDNCQDHRKCCWPCGYIRYINASVVLVTLALLPFPNYPAHLPAFRRALWSEYLITLFQNGSLGSFHQLGIAGHGVGKRKPTASFCWGIQSTVLPKYQIFAGRCPVRQLWANYTQTSMASPGTYSEFMLLIKVIERGNTEQEVDWCGGNLGMQ